MVPHGRETHANPLLFSIPYGRRHDYYDCAFHILVARGVLFNGESVVLKEISMLVAFLVGARIGSCAGGSRSGEGGRSAYGWCRDEAVQLRGTETNGAGEPGTPVLFLQKKKETKKQRTRSISTHG